MSNLAYTRPLGVWNIGVIRASELAELDAKTVKAPNFDGGGTYAPTAPIYVGGEGMQIKLVGLNTVESTAELDVLGSLIIHGYFESAASISNFFGPVHFGGAGVEFAGPTSWLSGSATTFEAGSTLNVSGDLTIAGRTYVSGPLDFSNAVNFGGTSSVAFYSGSDLSFAAGSSVNLAAGSSISCAGEAFSAHHEIAELIVTGVGSIQEKQVCSGAGRVVREGRLITSGTPTISPAVARNWLALTISAPMTVQISDAGAEDGDELFISNRVAAHRVLVNDPSGALIFALQPISGSNSSVLFQRIAGEWISIDSNLHP